VLRRDLFLGRDTIVDFFSTVMKGMDGDEGDKNNEK
jgi:hypothetical protein